MNRLKSLLMFALILHPLSAESMERPEKPNIVLVMADDMGIGDTSAYLGVRLMKHTAPISKTLKTPQLEAFSKQAMVFTDAHAPASMCSSTRYSLLTGRFAHRAYLKHQGWLPHGPNPPMIHKEMPTLPGMLKERGYHTMGIGKYHVGIDFDNGDGEPATNFYFHDVDFTKPMLDGPTHHGFDEYYGVAGNTEDPLDNEPRVILVNDGYSHSDRSTMKLIGMKKREAKILAEPDWDLRDLGPRYLKAIESYIDQRAQEGEKPFFLYFVPNANHNQRNVGGQFAVPEIVGGTKIKGESRYSDGTQGSDRDDMVWENDVIFGKLLAALRSTDDPRWVGHKLIENTLIIFTSDNGPNLTGVENNVRVQQSGGLRGKKAKIWEGGHRVPFMVYWKDKLESGLNRTLFSHTDLYATIASVVGHELGPNEARDSHDSLAYWSGEAKIEDLRPRVFFCNLGTPYLNDALAIRVGSKKLVLNGGLANPSIKGGSLGGLDYAILYDLATNPYEEGDFKDEPPSKEAIAMGERLLKIHNRGYARDLVIKDDNELIKDDGWHNLRNDISGHIGYEFRMLKTRNVSHLGMWDDHDKDIPVRPARNVPTELDRDSPSIPGGKKSTLAAPHIIKLFELNEARVKEIASVQLEAGNPGFLEGEFRYLKLMDRVQLKKNSTYLLTQSTEAGDGDQFHDPVSFDGLSPLLSNSVEIVRSVLVRDKVNSRQPLPSFSDMHEDYLKYRLPVGPTLKFD